VNNIDDTINDTAIYHCRSVQTSSTRPKKLPDLFSRLHRYPVASDPLENNALVETDHTSRFPSASTYLGHGQTAELSRADTEKSGKSCRHNGRRCRKGTWRLQTEFAVLMLSMAALPATSQVLPHIAVGGTFTTDFLVLNTGPAAASVSVAVFDDNGQPMSVNFPDLKAAGTGFHNSSVPPGGSLFVEAADPSGPTRGGSAFITAGAGIVVQVIFRSKAADGNFYEASVPSSAGSTRFTVAFDATPFQATGAQIITGIAVVNTDSANTAVVTCLAKDSSGATIPGSVTVPPLRPLGHWAEYNFPALVGKRGLLDCTSATKVSAIGLRFLGSYAFSSLPVVQSTALAAAPTPPANADSISGTWVSQGRAYLIFYADGSMENDTTLTSIPRRGTFQVSQNTIIVNWSPWLGAAAEQETINIIRNGNVTTLMRSPNVYYTRN
jgi:hypothetical protein